MSGFTTPEEDEIYTKLFGPDAPKPTSQPTRLARTFSGAPADLESGEGQSTLHRGDRPARDVMGVIPQSQRRAVVLCRNRPGRPSVIALVTTWPEGMAGSVVTTNPHNKFAVLGHDFYIECRCGITHHVDGARLRSAVMGLPRPKRKPPAIDVRNVERISPGGVSR